jgi:hypothetical protein
MNTDYEGSTVAATANKTFARATRCLLGSAALGAVLAVFASQALAGEKAKWELKTDSAYFAIYSYHCAPTFFKSVAKERPDGMEVAITQSRFRTQYNGDCRAFYLTEIEPRIDLREYGVVAIEP